MQYFLVITLLVERRTDISHYSFVVGLKFNEILASMFDLLGALYVNYAIKL
jgi:hypothetical protein